MLTYSVPEKSRTQITIGQIVEIPLRNKREKGMVFRILDTAPDFETLDIGRILSEQLLSAENLEFVRRLSEYNFCSYSKTLALFLPEKLWKSALSPLSENFLEIQQQDEEIVLKGKKQQQVLEAVRESGGIIAEAKLRKEFGISSPVIKNLLEKGILKRIRKPLERKEVMPLPTFPEFSLEQQEILASLAKASKALLFGPAGSGKTFLALKIAADALKAGKTALILFPERFLSTSLHEVFARYFAPESFDLYHSFLSEGEKERIWWRVREGRCRLIFGTRAALFLPFQNPGLIVLDEEHDTSYKNDQTPRYHARIAAEILGDIFGAKLLLQSATPSFESFTRAQKGELTLCTLSEKFAGGAFPPLTVVDLRQELMARNFSPLSGVLQTKIREKLQQRRQVLLFLNRRGKHSALVCRQCGIVTLCRHCHHRTTLHEDNQRKEFLLCHHCGHIDPIPLTCMRCKSALLKGFGVGTQEIERELKRLFPAAKVLRADRDSTARKNASAEIFEEFASGQADILIGTQIITKGLDLPSIGLVGILLADTELHLPDFRSSEYAFQLFTQVAGRTARPGSSGEVILQTYLPEHVAITAVAAHDYAGFYAQEMSERKSMALPPCRQMIRLIFADASQKKALQKAQQFHKLLEAKNKRSDEKERCSLALTPALSERKFNKFHYHIFISGAHPEDLLKGENLSGVRIDRDPIESF